MEAVDTRTGLNSLEVWTVSVGLILAGLAIAITGVSYISNMAFSPQWLVWVVGLAFLAVGCLTIEWPRGFRHPGEVPGEGLRRLLLLSIPLAFMVSSQVCGLGLRACNPVCHTTNLVLIVLAIVVAVRLHRGQSIGPLLIPMVVIALIPHCVCHAPINVLWHRMLGGIAPTCEMVPLAATLFSVSALQGVRIRYSALLVAVLFVVMVFIIVGGLLFGFPWQGCVDHPGAAG